MGIKNILIKTVFQRKEGEHLKTVFKFTESISKQTAIIKHDNDVKIYREIRKDHIEWEDGEGNPLINRNYIVIRYPKKKNVDLTKWKRKADDRYSIGFVLNELEDEIELLFYDRVTFSWRLDELEKTGLLTATQRVIPDWNEFGELFPCYINAKGCKQISYNVIFCLLQLPFMLYSDWSENKRNKKIQNQIKNKEEIKL